MNINNLALFIHSQPTNIWQTNHSTNVPTFLALQGVLASKFEFMSILQIYQYFWLYKAFQASKLNFIFILQIYQHFWLYKGFQASKLNFIFILQFYQHFWLYKESGLRNWILFPYYKSTNIFGSKRGLGLEIEFYFHSTNLPTFLALQGVWA